VNVLIDGVQTEPSHDVNQTTNPDVPEEIFRRLGTALPRFMDFSRRNRLWEGKLGVFDHSPPYQ